jgi:hypothetical protein
MTEQLLCRKIKKAEEKPSKDFREYLQKFRPKPEK